MPWVPVSESAKDGAKAGGAAKGGKKTAEKTAEKPPQRPAPSPKKAEKAEVVSHDKKGGGGGRSREDTAPRQVAATGRWGRGAAKGAQEVWWPEEKWPAEKWPEEEWWDEEWLPPARGRAMGKKGERTRSTAEQWPEEVWHEPPRRERREQWPAPVRERWDEWGGEAWPASYGKGRGDASMGPKGGKKGGKGSWEGGKGSWEAEKGSPPPRHRDYAEVAGKAAWSSDVRKGSGGGKEPWSSGGGKASSDVRNQREEESDVGKGKGGKKGFEAKGKKGKDDEDDWDWNRRGGGDERKAPREEAGMHCTVRKHSSIGCAIVNMVNRDVRQAILKQQEEAYIDGVRVKIKPHVDKETGKDSPNEIWVGWGHKAEKTTPLEETDLVKYFDMKHDELQASWRNEQDQMAMILNKGKEEREKNAAAEQKREAAKRTNELQGMWAQGAPGAPPTQMAQAQMAQAQMAQAQMAQQQQVAAAAQYSPQYQQQLANYYAAQQQYQQQVAAQQQYQQQLAAYYQQQAARASPAQQQQLQQQQYAQQQQYQAQLQQQQQHQPQQPRGLPLQTPPKNDRAGEGGGR